MVDERNDRWDKAIEVPGLGALNRGKDAEVNAVSCGSAGNCSVGGFYSGPRSQQGFVAVERNGSWGNAIDVPGLVALNKTQNAEVDDVSCGSAGNCVAGGFYSWAQVGERAFAVVERNGSWGNAIEVPGLVALDKAGYSGVESVSCASAGTGSAGTCAVSGYFTLHSGNQGGFLASIKNDRWTNAIAVAGSGALELGVAGVTSVSCATARNCTAVGDYEGRRRHGHAFAVAERDNRWSKAIQLPGLANQGKGGDAAVDEVSCWSAGNCAAAGSYQSQRDVHEHGIVAVERHGRWAKAIAVPGLAALNKGHRSTDVLALSCDRAGNCAAGGPYFDRPGHPTWFVAVERHGRWSKAIQVPGLAALNKRSAGLDPSDNTFALSCAPGGPCAVGGLYVDASGDGQAFVT